MAAEGKRRVALVGTGRRGAGAWAKKFISACGEWVEIVGLSDRNAMRLQRARGAIGTTAPLFTDPAEMLAATMQPTCLFVIRGPAASERDDDWRIA